MRDILLHKNQMDRPIDCKGENMTYVISDLHGISLKKFQDLLACAGFSDEDDLFVLGDTIDRGKNGVELLLWMMEQANVFHLLGNHEAMLLSVAPALFKTCEEIGQDDLAGGTMDILSAMLFNGAEPTLTALRELFRKSPDRVEELLDYMRDMPLYDSVEVNGMTYLLVHAGLGNFKAGKKLSQYTTDELLWHRPEPDEVYSLGDDVKVIFGHTPTAYYGKNGTFMETETWCCIDTSNTGPTLLRLDDWSVFHICGE